MDKKSKWLIGLFFTLIVIATVWKYYVFVTKQDFIILNHISCDQSIESCFAYKCEDGDVECDSTPFKKISKNAKNIDACVGEDCPELSCSLDEVDCSITLCSEDSLEDGEICVYDPVTILEEPTATSTDQTGL